MLKRRFEFTTLVIILFCVSFMLYLGFSTSVSSGYPVFNPTNQSEIQSGYYNVTNQYNFTGSTVENMISRFAGTLTSATGIIGTLGVILGTTIFPNPYLVFFGVFTLLAGFLNLPEVVIGMGKGLPVEFAGFFTLVITFVMILAAYSWYKGGNTP